jgi:hypothetical protein
MTPNRLFKNNFHPADGVKEPSLLHWNWKSAINGALRGQNRAKNAPKMAKVSVSEHTYPVSIYILDFDWIGWLGLAGKVKVEMLKTFTSEGRPSLWKGWA